LLIGKGEDDEPLVEHKTEIDDKSDKEATPLVDRRGAPKGSNTRLKATGLSQNARTVRAREFRRAAPPHVAEVGRRKNNDRNARMILRRNLNEVGRDGVPKYPEYYHAPHEEKVAVAARLEEALMEKRFQLGKSGKSNRPDVELGNS